MKTPSPKHQVSERLKQMLNIGKSKYEAKKSDDTADKVFSWSTYHNYIEAGTAFLKWAKRERGVKLLDKAQPFVNDYIQYRVDKGYSPSTVKRDVSALCKIYGMKRDEITVAVPPRRRADITRSRTPKAHDRGFSEAKNRDAVDFGKGTGLRRHELRKVKGGDVYEDGGKAYVRTKGKGGKVRDAVVRDEYKERVLALARRGGRDELIFPNGIKNRMDEHSYRREYAQALYAKYARPIETLKRDEKYVFRKDKKGLVCDKAAMLYVSEQLGHSRIGVIAGHYM